MPRVVHPLRLRGTGPAAQEGERHATWLELFFDLVFVLALSSITTEIGNGASPATSKILVAVALYMLVQWAWVSQSFYDTRYDPDDWLHRILVFVATAGAGGIAIGVRHLPEDLLLPAGYLVVRGALILMYLRVLLTSQAERSVATVYLGGFGVGWSLWLASLAVDPSTRPILWVVAVAIELSTPVWGYRWLLQHPVDTSHLPERLGQFTIILLGATLADLLNAVPVSHRSGELVGAAMLAFVVPVSIWWIYTTFLTSQLALSRLRNGSWYAFLHLPLGTSLVFLGWALGEVVQEIAHGVPRLPDTLRVLLSGSIVIAMLSGLLLQWGSLGSLLLKRIVIAGVGMTAVIVTAAVVSDPLLTLALTALSMASYASLVNSEIFHVRSARSNP
ncbi:low temperature requirement protein A [Micromonospora pisi]|uniref:low temperature requirement protein A n=1 Tax=Micromonospora pisi TaxID=589240 RepID=UPI001476E092|nr:low temperature requirement protein A [Micromonospora pisi]